MASAEPDAAMNRSGAAGQRRAGEFELPRSASGKCLTCGRQVGNGEILTAVLVELPQADRGGASRFQRLDYCPPCWEQSPWADCDRLLDEGQSAHPADRYGLAPVATWPVRASAGEKPRRSFVDDAVLMNFFLRLGEDGAPAGEPGAAPDPERLRLRFVLMLILMRHRKLRHERTERASSAAGGNDVWLVRLSPAMAEATATPADQIHRVVNVPLDADQAQQVANQLSQILQEDIDTREA